MFQLQLPNLVVETFSKVGSMMGPLAMIVIGMLIGDMDIKSIFVEKKNLYNFFLQINCVSIINGCYL